MTPVWQPLYFSLAISGLAAVLVTVTGTVLAYVLANRHFPGISVFEAMLTLPLVLPPTVVGYFLLVMFGTQGPIGQILDRCLGGYSIIFRPEAGILAAAIVSFPLLYLPTKAAFASVDPDLEASAKLMGATSLQVFLHVSLPLARNGIASGLLLAFARAIGEFGATTMVMGNIQGHQTLPIYIYNQTTSGDMQHAMTAVWVMSVLSLLLIWLYNRTAISP